MFVTVHLDMSLRTTASRVKVSITILGEIIFKVFQWK